jgi:hypothetical protein
MFQIQQNSLGLAAEGSQIKGAALRMGFPALASKWDQLALGGFMFNAGEGTAGTPLTAQAVNAAGIVLTAPTLRFTVPAGLTVFPHKLDIAIETAAGTLNEIAVIASDTDTYTSDGTAITARNLRMDDPRASAVANLKHCSGSAIVEAALVNPRHLFKEVRAAAFAAGETFHNVHAEWEDLIPLVGPCSFLVYLGAAGTALTYLFAMSWAEVPTVHV